MVSSLTKSIMNRTHQISTMQLEICVVPPKSTTRSVARIHSGANANPKVSFADRGVSNSSFELSSFYFSEDEELFDERNCSIQNKGG